jgi:ribosome-associated toxin RatA of RatAB toxin-antitoxin module
MAAPEGPAAWELVNEEADGVRVFRRDAAASDLAEAKAELIVNLPAERIWKVILDIESYPQFMPYVEEIKVMAADATGRYVYHRIDPPLVDGREYTLRMIDTVDSAKGIWLRSWSLADDKGPPPREDQVHLKVSDGSWRLEKLGTTSTRVTYWVYTDPGGSIPTWIANKANTISLPDVMRAVAQRAKDPTWKRD